MWHEVSLYLFNMLLSDWLVYLYDGTLCENPVPVYALTAEIAQMINIDMSIMEIILFL